MPKKNRTGTYFINVDLDIVASKGLDELVKALEPSAFLLSRFENRAGMELNKEAMSAESAIKGFVRLIQNLPPKSRALWNKAKRKTMNIRYSVGS